MDIVDKEVVDAVPERRRPEVQFGNVETFPSKPEADPQPEAHEEEMGSRQSIGLAERGRKVNIRFNIRFIPFKNLKRGLHWSIYKAFEATKSKIRSTLSTLSKDKLQNFNFSLSRKKKAVSKSGDVAGDDQNIFKTMPKDFTWVSISSTFKISSTMRISMTVSTSFPSVNELIR